MKYFANRHHFHCRLQELNERREEERWKETRGWKVESWKGQGISSRTHTHIKCMGGVNAVPWGPIMVAEQLLVSDSISEVNGEPGDELTSGKYQMPSAVSSWDKHVQCGTHQPPTELYPYFIIRNCSAAAGLTVCHGAVLVCIHTEDILYDSFSCSDSILCLLGRVYTVWWWGFTARLSTGSFTDTC